ncbi:DUF6233 domain-containing protein [Streptomyces sp. NPDC047009]|uniref:DUF6233 domain-containing protein n=1 Tax=Streptomyces sp. NPDC047009 TaxID=3154496 RepID=UPI0033C7028E
MPERPPVDTDVGHHREVREGPHLRARSRSDRPASGFVVQQKRTPSGPEPAVIHAYDCTMIAGSTHPIGDHEARVALTDPNIEPCAFCRPEASWPPRRLVEEYRSDQPQLVGRPVRSVGGGPGGCGRFSDRQEAPRGPLCPSSSDRDSGWHEG